MTQNHTGHNDTTQFLAQIAQPLVTAALPAYPEQEPIPYPDWDPDDAKQMPWKYIGYRVFSKWMASDQAFCIVRRFGDLNMRVMLALQDEIVELEDKLRVLDQRESRNWMPDGVENGSFRNDTCGERKILVTGDLLTKLDRYNQFVNQYTQLVSRPPVHKDDIKEVRTWFENHKVRHPQRAYHAIDPKESAFIHITEDLIPINPKIRSWFRNVLEKTALLKTVLLRRYLRRRPQDEEIIAGQIGDTGVRQTIWHNDRRVEKLSSAVIASVGLGMLVGPLWILEYVDKSAARLGVITGFIILFFFLISVATTARIFEVLAAAAAYSAVLMVFLQFGSH